MTIKVVRQSKRKLTLKSTIFLKIKFKEFLKLLLRVKVSFLTLLASISMILKTSLDSFKMISICMMIEESMSVKMKAAILIFL